MQLIQALIPPSLWAELSRPQVEEVRRAFSDCKTRIDEVVLAAEIVPDAGWYISDADARAHRQDRTALEQHGPGAGTRTRRRTPSNRSPRSDETGEPGLVTHEAGFSLDDAGRVALASESDHDLRLGILVGVIELAVRGRSSVFDELDVCRRVLAGMCTTV